MAEEKLQYQVTFKTRAEGTGAQQTAAAIRDLRSETERLNSMSTAESIGATEFAFYDLGAEIDRTKTKVPAFNNTMTTAASSSRNSANALLMVSQAAEDAQYGIRGVLNNIPPLVMALGGGAGIAGGVSLAAVALTKLIELFGETSKAAKTSAIDVELVADTYASGIVKNLEKADKKRREDAKKEKVEEAPDPAARDAEDNAIKAREDSIATLIAATNTLNDLMGRQVVAQEALAAQEAERARQRQVALDGEIKAENRKLQDAKLAAAQAERDRIDAGFTTAEAMRELEIQYQRRDVLREQRKEMEAQANLPLPALGGGDPTMAAARQAQFDQANATRNQARAALAAFDSTEMAMAEKAIEKLEAHLKTVQTNFEGAAQEAFDLAEQLERQQAATQENIRSILEKSEARTVADTVQTVTEANASIVEQMKGVVEEVEGSGTALTEIQKGGLETLKTVLADGKVTAEELDRGVQAVQQVQIGFKGDIAKLISLNTSVLEVMAAYRADLAALQQQVAGLKNRR